MKGIAYRQKRYVAVNVDFSEEGSMTPRSINWDDKTFVIDRVLDVRRASSLKVGGDGMRYTIRVGQTVTYLFFEDPCWFVEQKVLEKS